MTTHRSIQSVITSSLALGGSESFVDNLVGKLISLITRVDTSTDIWLLMRRRVLTVLKLGTSTVRRLASDLLWLSVVAGWLSRSEAEELVMPGITSSSLVLDFGGLGRDTAVKDNVLEHGLVGGGSDVDLLVLLDVLGFPLGFVAALDELAFGGFGVALIHVLDVAWVWVSLGLLLSLFCLLVDGKSKGVELGEVVADLLLESLENDWLQELENQGLSNTEESLVPGLLELDLEVRDVDLASVNLEEVGTILSIGLGERKLEVEAITTEENVGNTLISDAWEAFLPLDVVVDVSHISLDLRSAQHELLIFAAVDSLATHTEVGISTELHTVWKHVPGLNDDVLNDGIHLMVRELDSWEWNVTDVLEDLRKDDLSNILEQMFLEGWLSILVGAQGLEELLNGSAELLRFWVLGKLLREESGLVDNMISMLSVSVPEEETSLVDKTVVLVGGVWLKDVSLLSQDTADVSVNALEVVLELWIAVGIGIEIVEGIEKIVHGGVVGESLNEDLEIPLSGLNVVILSNMAVLVDTVFCESLSMVGIVLSKAEEGVDGPEVIFVSLDLDHHLLQSPDGLITAFLWDLVLEVAGSSVTRFPGAVLVLIWHLLVGTLLDVVNTTLETTLGVDAAVFTVALFVSSLTSNVLWIRLSVGVGSLSSDLSSSLCVVTAEWLVAVDMLTCSLLKVLSREFRNVVPCVVVGRSVDLVQLLLAWADVAGGLGGGITNNVSEDDLGILKELAELTVAENESSESLQSFHSLLIVLLCLSLGNWSISRIKPIVLSSIRCSVDEVL